MMFPNMDEYRFATFFVVVKQEEIKQELGVSNLYFEMIIKIVREFIVNNKSYIRNNFQNAYDSLDDKEFFSDVVNTLKQAKQNGIPLEIEIK